MLRLIITLPPTPRVVRGRGFQNERSTRGGLFVMRMIQGLLGAFVGVGVILAIIWVLNRPQMPTRPLVQAALA